MIMTTTPSIEGSRITSYIGLVTGEAIIGANIFRDILARITDIVGGRSGAYLDYEVLGSSMLMVTVSGTAVTIEKQ